MLERLSPHRRNIALAVLGLLVAWFAWTVRSVLNPLILGYLLAYILNPMVQNLERRGWGRRAAANLIFIAFFLVTTVTTAAVLQQGRQLVHEVSSTDLAERVQRNLPTWILSALDKAPGADAAGNGAAPAPGSTADDVAPEVTGPEPAKPEEAVELEPGLREALGQALGEFWEQLRAEEGGDVRELALRQAGTAWPYLRAFFGSVVALATLLFLLPIYAYFLLFELDRIHDFVLRYVPDREKGRFERIGTKVGEVISNFFRGRLTICFLKGAVITVGLWAVGVPYFVFLGMGSGFLSLAPFVGPLFGFLAAFVLELVDVGPLASLLKTGVVFGVAELLEGYVLLPKILGDSLGLHPVVILVSVFVGGAALGMFGFLVAVPLAAALVIIARELVLPALAAWADEEP